MGLCSQWTSPPLWHQDTWTTEKAYGFLIARRQSREVRNVEGKIYECSIWQKEKLRFLPCPPDKLYGVSKGSSVCRQERVEEKRWSDIFGNISPPWCLQKGNPQRALVSLPRELQWGNVLLLHCQTSLVRPLHFEHSEHYFYHQKKKKKVTEILHCVNSDTMPQFWTKSRQSKTSALSFGRIGMFLWILQYRGGKSQPLHINQGNLNSVVTYLILFLSQYKMQWECIKKTGS